jgi:hypothetical protein
VTTASPRDPHSARTLGFAGSLLLAAGGLASGALPHGLDLLSPHATAGLITAYLGLALLVAGWWRLGRVLTATRPRDLLVTLAWWGGPLAVGAPLFSRDVYAYLAQGAMVHAGLDVYRQGPADLGGPLAAEVPAVWQHTPTPYGPVFLICVAAVAAVVGTHILAGVLALRLLAVVAVGVLAWLTPRVGEHCGVDARRALWLGVLNPLVLLHLVAGAHNDALMLGLLVGGVYAAFTGRMVLATALVTAGALVKAPAALGLLVIAVLWADRWTGRSRLPRALLATAALAAAGTVLVTWLAGTGYGWIGALRTPVSATNWSVSSVLGRATAHILTNFGSDLAGTAVPAWRWIGLAATVAAAVFAWWYRSVLGPVQAVGLALGAVAVFGPATRPWYLLWGVVPLAAAAPPGLLRRLAALTTVALAGVVLPSGYPPGSTDLALAGLGLALGYLVLRFLQPAEPPVGARAWAGPG